MRDFKVKVWHKESGRMYYEVVIDFTRKIVLLGSIDMPIEARFDEVEILQYTGLYDIHNKEICEGDVCLSHYKGNRIVGPMIWNKSKAQFGLDAEVEFESGDHVELITAPEILGNIYENKELLKS